VLCLGILLHCRRLISPAQGGCIMAGSRGVADFRTADIPTFDLAQRRKALEAIVKPYVTTKSTDIIIEFRGKKRYLGKLQPGTIHAVMALQLLYGIEAARAAGDFDKAIRKAVAFAGFSQEVENLQLWNSVSVDALAKRVRRSATSRVAANKTNLKKEAKRPDYYSPVQELMAGGMRYTPACAQVAGEFDVDPQTVRNNTTELWPRKPKPKRK
jgi:hypothetical protein